MKYAPIELPPEEDLGPCMQALVEKQRKFVFAWVRSGGVEPTKCARAAGYSDASEGCKVAAFRLLRSEKVQAALREEADRTLNRHAVVAILGLGDLLNSENEKIRLQAIENVLDRTGYGRKTFQDITVEHTDGRSTDALLAALEAYAAGRRAPKQIEGSASAVTHLDKPETICVTTGNEEAVGSAEADTAEQKDRGP